MPVQTQMSSFAKKMGARVVQAHEEHKDKPIDVGNKYLPPGLKNAIAKLSVMYTKEYPDDKNGPGTKGQTFFRASAIVMQPESFNGELIAGQVTSVIIPLCDMPAKGNRKPKSFSENWYEFQNLFKLLGIVPPNENKQTDPTGQRTEAYYFAAMKTLTDPTRPPTYVSFSTRGWTPPATPAQPKPTEMVFEEWHGLTELKVQHDPGAGITTQPDQMSLPPTGQTAPQITPSALNPHPTEQPTEQFNEFAAGQSETDPADIVAASVETAMNDPEGATYDGRAASARLEDMAWANGWTKEQTAGAADWAAIGDMALTPPEVTTSQQFPNSPTIAAAAAGAAPASSGPTVGSKHKFAKRTKDGAKLKDAKGTEFPPQDIEVVTVDPATKTCTVKSVKDGKTVVDIRSKQPVAVKFEWLE